MGKMKGTGNRWIVAVDGALWGYLELKQRGGKRL
jgi:hypothetical protein